MRLHADEEKGEREAGVGLRNVWGGGVVGRGGGGILWPENNITSSFSSQREEEPLSSLAFTFHGQREWQWAGKSARHQGEVLPHTTEHQGEAPPEVDRLPSRDEEPRSVLRTYR